MADYSTLYKVKPVYTPEEEKKVLLEYKKHPSDKLKYEIASHNMQLVFKFAYKWAKVAGNTLEFDDLVQEGWFGLLRAIELFDVDKDTKFSTYACQWIEQKIRRVIANEKDIIRLPVHLQELKYRYDYLQGKRFNQCGEVYTFDEAVKVLELTECEIRSLKYALNATNMVSLDTPIGEVEHYECDTLGDFIASENTEDAVTTVEQNELRDVFENLLQSYLKGTPKKTRKRNEEIIRRRTGLNESGKTETLGQIGSDYGITRERVRQIEFKFLRFLKRNKSKLKGYR